MECISDTPTTEAVGSINEPQGWDPRERESFPLAPSSSAAELL